MDKEIRMENVLEIKGLKKCYKDFTLDVADAKIPMGYSTAIIGANGAGKTTLLDILCGANTRDFGTTIYFGEEKDELDDKLRNRIGYCSANDYFPKDWNLKMVKKAMPYAFDNFSVEAFEGLCKRFELNSDDKKKIGKYSDGNKMRAALSAVLARDTDVLLLDEPASMIDPLGRDLICDLFRDYLLERDGERSIVFSTHNIADMEFVTDYAIFMSSGRVVEQGFVEDLKQNYAFINGDAQDAKLVEEYMYSLVANRTNFQGIAPVSALSKIKNLDVAIEVPNLQQLSIGILRKAKRDEKRQYG